MNTTTPNTTGIKCEFEMEDPGPHEGCREFQTEPHYFTCDEAATYRITYLQYPAEDLCTFHANYALRVLNTEEDVLFVGKRCPEWQHDISVSSSHCEACNMDLCEICGADHATSDGHNLNDPQYWGV